jgi:hypothetical protein
MKLIHGAIQPLEVARRGWDREIPEQVAQRGVGRFGAAGRQNRGYHRQWLECGPNNTGDFPEYVESESLVTICSCFSSRGKEIDLVPEIVDMDHGGLCAEVCWRKWREFRLYVDSVCCSPQD